MIKSSFYIVLISTTLLWLYSNCSSDNSVRFLNNQTSLLSASTGGGVYDGKPGSGYYCRVFDNMACRGQVANIQGLLEVKNTKVQLLEDNCASTSFNFLTSDKAVTFSSLMEEYISVSRGVFKKCDVDANKLPFPPTQMTEVYCLSNDANTALVISKNLASGTMDFKLNFKTGTDVRSVSGDSVTKNINATGSSYTSLTTAFSLSLGQDVSQEIPGQMQAVVDQQRLNVDFNCRQASIKPTVVIPTDMELSSSWIDTSQLVAYWKLNESNATEGATIVDSSLFGVNGTLLTGTDGLNKGDSSVHSGAIRFDGSNDRINIPRPTDNHLDFDLRSFSFMAWIKTPGPTAAFQIPFYHGGSNFFIPGYDMECNSVGTCGTCISDGTGVSGTSQACVTFGIGGNYFGGQWTHLTTVVDRSVPEIRSYTNGVLIARKNISAIGSVRNTTENIQIGSNGGTYPFSGSIDDVAIWNRALTEPEILTIFQRLRPKFY